MSKTFDVEVFMSDERAKEIYENGAHLSTFELMDYIAHTAKLNGAEFPALEIFNSPSIHKALVKTTAELFDWRLEFIAWNKWYLHPWGA
jgi:hypothetical protein